MNSGDAKAERSIFRLAISGHASRAAWVAAAALLFLISAAATVIRYSQMSAMGAMPMPGGWTMSAIWMPMCGQTWLAAAMSFLGMWSAMMMAMMLPSLLPMLRRYPHAAGGIGGIDGLRPGGLVLLAGAGYFLVWIALGALVYPFGSAFASLAMRLPELARAIPLVAGTVVLSAGALQLSKWKARRLACCRAASAHCAPPLADSSSAFRQGLRLGLDCTYCCAGMTAILLALGIMDLWAMIAVTVAITAERLMPNGVRIARGIGLLAVASGVFMIVREI